MKVIYSSETSVLTSATWRHIPEDGILYILYVYNPRPKEGESIGVQFGSA
jgi:hypothetical protein